MYERRKTARGAAGVYREAARIRKHNDELEAAIDRVRRLHNNGESDYLSPGKWCAECGQEYPCKTIRALRAPKTRT